MSRTYLVSLPVAITVAEHGLVLYDVDTSEAGQAIAEDDDNLYYEGDLAVDIEAVEADHARRTVRQWRERLGELAAKPWPLDDSDQAQFEGLRRLLVTFKAAR